MGLLALFTIVAMPPGSQGVQAQERDSSRALWQDEGSDPPQRSVRGAQRAVRAERVRTVALDRAGIKSMLAGAARERTRAARERPLVISLPAPGGGFERFAIVESPVMEPGLAAKHPDIKTYAGRGIDDPTASIRMDITPIGFHASVRGPKGVWYIDPYYHLDDSLYASYYTKDAASPDSTFFEAEDGTPAITSGRGYYLASDMVEVYGSHFAANALVSITISDPEGNFASRLLEVVADDDGAFEVSFEADPAGNLGTHQVDASDGAGSAQMTYDVVAEGDVEDPPVGDQLRTYRLALLTNPQYATYHGGSANVTAAKVTLINRVTQIYEDETAIRMVLVANNDVLNLDTTAQMTGANGPCGGTACYTTAQNNSCSSGGLTRTRQVIGLLIGASNYDIGHLALGTPGGGIASLGVVGGNNKAQGCTGLTTPIGDFFAVDYVAHEMGHQFNANHTFNGTQSNCSGGNRSAANSVEPGSGSSIMAYAGICAADNLQPHTDPYWSFRSFDEIVNYTSAAETNISEVQMSALTGFNTNGMSFQLRYNGNDSAPIVRGTNFTTAGVQAAIQGISGWPAGGTAAVSALGDTTFTITFGGTLANTNVSELELVNCTGGCTGYIGEIAKGGQTTRRGTVTPTGNNYPIVTAPAPVFIPLRTPFALTASAVDPDGHTLTYLWEQSDRGAATGTALQSNTKANGPLFRVFGKAADVSPTDTLLYHSPGQNHPTTDPTRVFPDMEQILANRTNAETGTCPAGDLDCFSEFLPTSAYVGFAGVNASPARLNFRITARDNNPGGGGVNTATTTLTLATGAGPFLVTSPNTAVTYDGSSSQTVTWAVANTDIAPVGTTDVKISLSIDGGFTYPYTLAASTPNNGSALVTIPNVGTTQARVKVEAIGNVFFDVSNANFTIRAIPEARLVGSIVSSSSSSLTLRITNTGVGPANNVVLNAIVFRTLLGTGDVTTTASLPISVGMIPAGGFTDVVIPINRPGTVLRYSVTENGTLQDPPGTRSFSLVQMVQ
jgi:hypothetical protein